MMHFWFASACLDGLAGENYCNIIIRSEILRLQPSSLNGEQNQENVEMGDLSMSITARYPILHHNNPSPKKIPLFT